MKKHKHCKEIKAWADGNEIELYSDSMKSWIKFNIPYPEWYEHTQYRVYDPYRELKEAEVEGKTIQLICDDTWYDLVNVEIAYVHPVAEYRIKPDEPKLIKRWQWVFKGKNYLWLKSEFFTEQELKEYLDKYNLEVVQKAEWTEIKVKL